MIKIIYYLRVVFVGVEFLSLVFVFVSYYFSSNLIEDFLIRHAPSGDAAEWLALFPAAVAGWVLNESKSVLFPGENKDLVLHEWPGYWRLKAHYNVGIFYCVTSALPCVVLWVFNFLFTSVGIMIFVACFMVSGVSAFSFHQANVRLREILVRI